MKNKNLIRVILVSMFVGIFCLTVTAGERPRKVLIIGIDGCRLDFLNKEHTPNIDSIYKTNITGRTVYPSNSGPGWTSMMTGCGVAKHGIDSNKAKRPARFSVLEILRSSFSKTVHSYSTWAWINKNLHVNVDKEYTPNWQTFTWASDEQVAELVSRDLQSNPGLDAIFVQFNYVDKIGHSRAGKMNKGYREAIKMTDVLVGQILRALASRLDSNNHSEEWLIIISTDHGKKDNGGHGGSSDKEMGIWMRSNFGSTSTSFNIYDIGASVFGFMTRDDRYISSHDLDGRNIINDKSCQRLPFIKGYRGNL